MSEIPLQFNLEDRSEFDRVHEISTDATLPVLDVQLLNGSTPVNLASASIKFTMKDEAGAAKVNAADAVLVDAATGKIQYVWVAADVDTAGRFIGQFLITIGTVSYKIPNNVSQKLYIIIGAEVAA